jgi:hypothetical protein
MQTIEELAEEVFINRDQYQNVNYPIYVLSKGRAGKALSMNNFEEAGLKPIIFVESEEEIEYRKYYKNVVVLPESGRGISYVRNFIKQYSIEQGDEWHWQVDDNILDFRIRLDNKNVKFSCRNILSMAEYITDQYNNIGCAGLTHTAFAFAKKNHLSINRQTYSCVLVNNSVPIHWDYGPVEDTDYSLQVLSKGLCTLLFDKLLINKEVTKQGNGGNENTNEWRLLRSKKLQEKWPQAKFKVTEQYGRVKISPSRIWGQFPQRPERTGQKSFLDAFFISIK